MFWNKPKKDTGRHFHWGYERAIKYLLAQTQLIPGRSTRQVRSRRQVPEGDYRLTVDGKNYSLFLKYTGFGGYYIYSDSIKTVYMALRKALNEVEKQSGKREINQPVLSAETNGLIKRNVLDFFTAIDDFGTSKGFGNVGIILTGPAGTGKSETMRWLSHIASKDFGRESFKLSFGELQKILIGGIEINNNESLVLIDDIDVTLLRDRKLQGSNQLTSQFLTCLDGIDKREGRVIVISTNEDIGEIDPALKRPGRFETIIKYDYPDSRLIHEFCTTRDLDINPDKFSDWSFARIDMFISKFKVAEFMHGTQIDVFYEQFIHDWGESDETVESYSPVTTWNGQQDV